MISNRIKTLASFIPEASTIADVGTDHGYLIIEAFLSRNIKRAYAIDNKDLPLTKSKNNISDYPFYDNVEFVLSDGLDNLQDTVDVIVIAGMGGILIKEILEKVDSIHKNSKLILGANRKNYELRRFLMENNYKIVSEVVVQEAKKFYEIIVAEVSDKKINYEELDLVFGPILRKEKSKNYKEKLKDDLRILNNIPVKTKEVSNKIKLIEENL